MSDQLIGTIWESKDLRDNGRRVKVVEANETHVYVENLDTGRRSRSKRGALVQWYFPVEEEGK